MGFWDGYIDDGPDSLVLAIQTKNQTELSYTVSAWLVDTQTGKALKSGIHCDDESRTVKRNLGFAEAPAAEPLLTRILVELSEKMLED